MASIIGRKAEISELSARYNSGKSEFIAIYGRRRVGKTFLIKEYFKNHFAFQHTGLSLVDKKSGQRTEQLKHFFYSLRQYGWEGEQQPSSWLEAFFLLKQLLGQKDDGSRQVVFIDELPWMDTPGSGFVTALESFWNGWGDCRDNLMLVVCGSATSWMSNRLINDKGGLYGRLTDVIKLEPFTLSECAQFYEANGINLSRYDITEGYMILGGIPYYMDYFAKGFSLAQNIDNLFFKKNAKLKDEFSRLFRSVFINPEMKMKIVRALGTCHKGLTREQIVQKTNIKGGGTLSESLAALEESDFLVKYVPYGCSKRAVHYPLAELILHEKNDKYMNKKLYISLKFSILAVEKTVKILVQIMYNFAAKFAKILETCKKFSTDLVNDLGNIPRRGVVPKFSDLEVIAMSMTAESESIDSENRLFELLKHCKSDFPNLISRRQYNDRRKITSGLCEQIRKRIAYEIDGGEDYFCVDSKPIPVCRTSRGKRCKMGKEEFSTAPDFGFCASQNTYYFGYKLHELCGLSGVVHSYDLSKASVHDIHYLNDIKPIYSNCSIFGDKAYISADIQLDLFETSKIRLECPYRLNQKNWKPTFKPFAKARKRVETNFSQLTDQYMVMRNYAKQTDGLFARIVGKISAQTIAQYFNYINNKPIGRVKYALI